MGGSRASSSTELDECISKHVLHYAIVLNFLITPDDDERRGLSFSSTQEEHYSPVDGVEELAHIHQLQDTIPQLMVKEGVALLPQLQLGGHSRTSSTSGGAGIDM